MAMRSYYCDTCGLEWRPLQPHETCPRCALAAERSNHEATREKLEKLRAWVDDMGKTLAEMNELAGEVPPLGSEGPDAQRR